MKNELREKALKMIERDDRRVARLERAFERKDLKEVKRLEKQFEKELDDDWFGKGKDTIIDWF